MDIGFNQLAFYRWSCHYYWTEITMGFQSFELIYILNILIIIKQEMKNTSLRNMYSHNS